MDKISDKIAALPANSTYFSLEFFPPKTQQGFSNLHARLERMARALRPLFVNVTWGAGGSTASKSLALAEMTQRGLGLTTCLHLTCTNMSRGLVDEALEQARALGVRNILALRGDPPRSEEYREDTSSGREDATRVDDDSNVDFRWAVDLVRYIRAQYGDYFCIGIAGYPEGHSDQSCPDDQSLEHDLPFLVEKTEAGADFIMTQLFYDVEAYLRYERRLREHPSGAFKTVPIVPGLMPVQSYQILRRTTKLSHASLPTEILQRFEAIKGDDEAVKRVGIDVLSEIIGKMKEVHSPAPRGFHLYTLNLEKVVSQILERCDLIPPEELAIAATNSHNGSEEAVSEEDSDGFTHIKTVKKPNHRRKSSLANSQPRNRVVVSLHRPRTSSNSSHTSAFEAREDQAGVPKEAINSRANTLAISEGQGDLGRLATWDDFPNGRWGDARSPAYGEIDGYGTSLHISTAAARRLWGEPRTAEDISELFRRYLKGDLATLPWSEESLQPETLTIQSELLRMADKGWWSIASQPALKGVRSSDPIFGWGPKNGFVFQKPFVEFFLPNRDWQRLKVQLDEDDQVTYFASNAAGSFQASDEDSVNPVTWGTFTGKEIITPTIIEGVSFRAWCEEAFGIWKEWRRMYAPGSASARLLTEVAEGYWLVNVIHHGFLDPEALWKGLLWNAR